MGGHYRRRHWVGCVCDYCGTTFTAKRKDARFCKNAHRQAWYRAMKGSGLSVGLTLSNLPRSADRPRDGGELTGR